MCIQKLKNNKATGLDQTTGEMLKSGGKPMIKQLTKMFNKIWSTNKNPTHFKSGVIVKIPKKGDLSNTNNWRGITLLSIPGKVLCGIIADRIRPAVDTILREEQAGFRANRSCADQIFSLRRLIEKMKYKRRVLLINYIDFEKAFDSLHRDTLWNILRDYGIPAKIVDIIKDLYEGSECCVQVGDEYTTWFRIITGVRQGCILSPLLFIIVIDWILKNALMEKRLNRNN